MGVIQPTHRHEYLRARRVPRSTIISRSTADMKPNIKGIKAFLSSRTTIGITGHLVRLCGYDDMRDFFADIHAWGHTRDFTYDTTTENLNRFLRKYLRETYLND